MNNAITLPYKDLKSAVSGLGKVVSKTHSLPIVTSVRINRDKSGQVSIQATDLDSFTTYRFDQPQEAKAETIIVPFKELVAAVKNSSSSENIQVEQTAAAQGVIRYNVGATPMQQRVECLEHKDWPTLPEIKEPGIPFPNELRQSLLQAMQCSSHDCTRVVLQGAYLDTSDKKLHYVVGTDGRHLFAANSFQLPLKEPVIVPNTKFLNWSGFVEDGDWMLNTITSGEKEKRIEIQFESNHWTFTTRAVDGTYPNWRNILLSAELPTKIEFGPEAVELIKQVAPKMPGFDHVNQPIGIAVKGYNVSLKARKDDKDDWTLVPVPSVRVVGKPVTIHLNRTYLLKAMEFGLTELSVEEPLSAMRFRNQGRQMIIMPVNVEHLKPTPTNAPVTPTTSTTTPASEVKTPAAQPQPTTTTTIERKHPMPKEPQSSTNGTALNKAIQQVEVVKEALKEVVHGLNEVLDTLKLAQKEQKNVDREIDSVRSTIKSLQKVSL